MSADELVDVVDADDRVLRQASRAEVRRDALRHRAVYIVLVHPDGRVYVHRRTATKDVYPSHYDVMVGGVVGAGESYAAAAAREVEEEVGIRASELRRVTEFRFAGDGNLVNGEIFECRSSGPFVLQPEEIVSGEWHTVEQVAEIVESRPFCPDSAQAFALWRERRC